VDARAADFDALLAHYGITPPTRTTYAEPEHLVDTFGEGVFDLVLAQDSVDHMRDPLETIRQMLLVTKANGFVILRHAEKEGAKRNHDGPHHWNFCVCDGEFIIENTSCGLAVSRALAHLGLFRSYLEGDTVVVEIQKKDRGAERGTSSSPHPSAHKGRPKHARTAASSDDPAVAGVRRR
jgi:hypothetical protein